VQLAGSDDLPRDRYLIGDPETVAAGVHALVERTGAERLFFWGRPPGLPIELANRSIERFAKEVVPLVEAAARA
jgi:alkanesulfonate monooxygenase SsuD/methylene tetrahydromethanopterin reductase-like flavin-dependent oxidoreductase (luciferase family)